MKVCTTVKILQFAKMEEFKSVIIVLGGFHTQMTHTKVIGKYLESSEISQIWAEVRSLLEKLPLRTLSKRELLNWVVWAYKLSYEALWTVLWPILTSWAKDNRQDDTLIDLSTQLASHFDDNSEMTQQRTILLSMKLDRRQILSRNLMWFIKMTRRTFTATGGSAWT